MNKITLLKIALLCSIFSFAQNIDTTKYQKVTPNDTIKNYYDQNNPNNASGDTIKNYYPPDNQQNQPQPSDNQGSINRNPPRNVVKKPILQQSPLMQKLYFGSYVYLTGYGTPNGAVIYYELSPHVGYKFNDKLSAGAQILYNNAVFTGSGSTTSYSIIGGGLFARYLPISFLFVQVEYDILTVPSNYLGNHVIKRTYSGEKIAGLAFRRAIAEKASYYIMLMYDFNPETNSPYFYSPLIYRIGFSYNF